MLGRLCVRETGDWGAWQPSVYTEWWEGRRHSRRRGPGDWARMLALSPDHRGPLLPPGSYRIGFAGAARKMKNAILQLKQAQACIPPCGLQDFARLFRCRGCYSRDCDLPLDCPVRDVMVPRGDQAMFPCVVNYQLPQEEIAYSWKFAEGVSRGGAGCGKGLATAGDGTCGALGLDSGFVRAQEDAGFMERGEGIFFGLGAGSTPWGRSCLYPARTGAPRSRSSALRT
uniref:Uncharacterized protein n=1 Tax=Oryctolagus cuniculus TaxID=9986 RepID=A0A5F9D649_RABIT